MAEENKSVDYEAEFKKMQGEYEKLKSNFDKASSDIAEYKRKEREKMSEDEKKNAEIEEREKYYKELERKIAFNDYNNELSDITDEATRVEIANLFADGKILEAMKKHKEFRGKNAIEMEKKIKAELLKQNPQASAQDGKPIKTKAEIMAIKDAEERQRLISENINLFT